MSEQMEVIPLDRLPLDRRPPNPTTRAHALEFVQGIQTVLACHPELMKVVTDPAKVDANGLPEEGHAEDLMFRAAIKHIVHINGASVTRTPNPLATTLKEYNSLDGARRLRIWMAGFQQLADGNRDPEFAPFLSMLDASTALGKELQKRQKAAAKEVKRKEKELGKELKKRQKAEAKEAKRKGKSSKGAGKGKGNGENNASSGEDLEVIEGGEAKGD